MRHSVTHRATKVHREAFPKRNVGQARRQDNPRFFPLCVTVSVRLRPSVREHRATDRLPI
jgi:hypothetical protein